MEDNNNTRDVIGIMIAVLSGIALVFDAVQRYEDSKKSDEE